MLRISPAGSGQLVKMLTALEPHGIFTSNLAYFFHFNIVQPLYVMQNVDEASPSIYSAGRGFFSENAPNS